MTFADLVAADPDAPAVDDLTRRRTRGELFDRALRLGHWLLDDGGVPVDGHVAMLIGNRVELIDLVVAAQHSGVWITAINWHLTASEVAYILDDSGSTILFTDPEHEAVARAAAAAADHDVSVVLAGPELDALAAHPSDAPFPLDGPGGGTMLYTSGTTGRPKGVKRRRQPIARRDARRQRGRRAAARPRRPGPAPRHRTAVPRRAARLRGHRPGQRRRAGRDAAVGRVAVPAPDPGAGGAQQPRRADHVRAPAAACRRRSAPRSTRRR